MTPGPAKDGQERRDAAEPWPDNPDIPDLGPAVMDEDPFLPEFRRSGPPDDDEIEQQETLMLRRQGLFRWAAEAIAVGVSRLPEVERVAAFGAVSQPLTPEVPRFAPYWRYGIKILHECADLDLAIWLTRLTKLGMLKKAIAAALACTHDTPYGGVAHHQVDVHLLDFASGEYRGRLYRCNPAGSQVCKRAIRGRVPGRQRRHHGRRRPVLIGQTPPPGCPAAVRFTLSFRAAARSTSRECG